MEKIRLQVYRYNPDVDAKPYMKDYELEIEPTDVKLLDAIIKLKAQDDSLSFRRSCRGRYLRFRRHEHQWEKRFGVSGRYPQLDATHCVASAARSAGYT